MTPQPVDDKRSVPLPYATPTSPPSGVVWDGVATAAAILVIVVGVVFIVLSVSVFFLGR